ncbi:MAG: HYR domain-containing protein [Planctomycetota bacterium]|jgi:hypothetical protein
MLIWRCVVTACVAIATVRPAAAEVVLDRAGAVDAVVDALPGPLLWSPFEDYGFGRGFEGLLPAASTVRPYFLDNYPYPGHVTTLSGPMYLFWQDLAPLERFPHPTRFIFVDATVQTPSLADGTIVVQEQGWWPIVTLDGGDELELFGPQRPTSALPGGPDNPDGLASGEVPTCLAGATRTPGAPAGGPPPTPGDNPCAIVVRGQDGDIDTNADGMVDDNDQDPFQNDVDLVRQAFLDRGIPANRVLTAPDDGVADKQVLQTLIQQVCNAMPPCDHIYLYISSHGGLGTDGDGACVAGLHLGDDWVPVENTDDPACSLCGLLAPLGEKNVPVDMLFDACYTGKLVDPLRDATRDDGQRKFPLGAIMAATGASSCAVVSDVRETPNGPIAGINGQYTWAFVRCWNDPKADTDNDGSVSWAEAFNWVCEGDNGKIDHCDEEGNPIESDVKDRNPVKAGLRDDCQEKTEDGFTYTTKRRDDDCDGKYDTDEFECDGPPGTPWGKVRGRSVNPGESDWPASSRSEIDTDGDGEFDRRYDFAAGQFCSWGVLVCSVLVDGRWVPEAEAAQQSTNQPAIEPRSGDSDGGTPVTIVGEASWSPAVKAFVGLLPLDDQIVEGNVITGTTRFHPPGVVNVSVADFDPTSPGFGLHEQVGGYEYLPVERVTAAGPSPLECATQEPVAVFGDHFNETALVFAGDTPALVSGFVDPQTILAILPAVFCDEPVDVTVMQEGAGGPVSMTLGAALRYRPARDRLPPEITCPETATVTAGFDGLARLGPEYTATAIDEAGEATVFRRTLGALPVGEHVVEFEAIDERGNRSACGAAVVVDPPRPCPGDASGDGLVNVDDLVLTTLSWGPCPPPPAGCPADQDGNGAVDVDDLLTVIFNWGDCSGRP